MHKRVLFVTCLLICIFVFDACSQVPASPDFTNTASGTSSEVVSDTTTYSQIKCAFDAGLSAKVVEKALEECIPMDIPEVEAIRVGDQTNILSTRLWRKDKEDGMNEVYSFTSYTDSDAAEQAFEIYDIWMASGMCFVRIDSCVITVTNTNGNDLKTMLKKLGLIDTIPEPHTIPAAITMERSELVSAYIRQLTESPHIKKDYYDDLCVLYYNETGSEWVTCYSIEEGTLEDAVQRIREEINDGSYLPGTKVLYDDHYIVFGFVYPMEKLLISG